MAFVKFGIPNIAKRKKIELPGPLALLITLIMCLGCSNNPNQTSLFPETKPIIIELSNQGKWKEANELLKIHLLKDKLTFQDSMEVYILMAENFRFLEDYGKAERTFIETIQYAKSHDNSDFLGEAYYGLGDLSYLNWAYFKQADAFDKSKALLDTALEYATAMNNDVLKSKVYYRQGTIFQIEGAELESKRLFQKGFDISFSNRDTAGIIRNHTHLAVALRRSGDMDSALFHHSKAHELASKINRNYSEGHALGNLGSYYLALEDYTKALEYYRKAHVLAEELGHGLLLCKCLLGLATIHENLGETSTAMNFAEVGIRKANEKAYKNFENAFNKVIERLK